MRVGRQGAPPGVGVGHVSFHRTRNEEVTHSKSKQDAMNAHLASELYCSAGMKRLPNKSRTVRLLRWVFQRNDQLITCQLDHEGARASYTLSLVPHWDVRQAATETFEAGVSAFRRHAAIAEQLRSQGWTLAAYSGAAL